MNDLQKKFVIIGVPTFIVWLSLVIINNTFYYLWTNPMFGTFLASAILGYTNQLLSPNWVNVLTFISWLGSLIGFFLYKD